MLLNLSAQEVESPCASADDKRELEILRVENKKLKAQLAEQQILINVYQIPEVMRSRLLRLDAEKEEADVNMKYKKEENKNNAVQK